MLAAQPRRGLPSTTSASWLQPLRLSVCAKETLRGGLKAKGWVVEGPGEVAEELGRRDTGQAAGCWVPAATLGARTARTHARLTRTAHTHTPARAQQHARPASRSRPQATVESQKRAFTRVSQNGKAGDIVPPLQLTEHSSPICHLPSPRPVLSLHF